MQLFFYGTLMDPDVSAVVLGRRLAGDQFAPAFVKDSAGWSWPGGPTPCSLRIPWAR